MGAIDLTSNVVGFACLIIFVWAYAFVVLEEKLHLRKCKPVLFAAGVIWILIAAAYRGTGHEHLIGEAIRHYLVDFAELFFFLMVAMTYINAMIYRNVFGGLKKKLVEKGFSYRQLFWLTGILAFLISPVLDNLTTALILSAVVMALGKERVEFVPVACINIVVAANAGGAFSPFGDLTTLMVWQKGVVQFWEFFALFIPSVVNFLVPALIMQFAIPKGRPEEVTLSGGGMDHGGLMIIILFMVTIITTVILHLYLHIPAVFGMLLGLTYLKIWDYLLQVRDKPWTKVIRGALKTSNDPKKFSVFDSIAQSEWDTLFFFYGVIMAVGGLGFIGYLELTSSFMYNDLGHTAANVLVGVLSALVDNIPVMFSVLAMEPNMSLSQWLLVTLSAGVGGSMLSIGSAAGVAVMGQAKGQYTFMQHLKWAPIIGLGFVASVIVHIGLHGL